MVRFICTRTIGCRQGSVAGRAKISAMALYGRANIFPGVIDTEQKLAAFLPVLHAADWVAVDTEADSLHAYPEKVCLIQISTVSGDRLVDPLARLNLDPLLDALSGHELIMHGADYDLRLLRKHHEFVPSAIFDTMLAARLLGLRQFGLSHLVEKYLGVKLEKGPQKANWALRPLTERMERYARNDTHYLKPLADRLKPELEAKGRLAWHQESCARLIQDSTTHRPADMDSVWRIKGSHLLEPPGAGRPAGALAVARNGGRRRQQAALLCHEPSGAGRDRRRRRGGPADRAVPAQAHLRAAPGRLDEGHRARTGPLPRPPSQTPPPHLPPAERRREAPVRWSCRSTATRTPPRWALIPP